MNEVTQIGDWQKISDLGSGAFGIVSLWKNNSNNDFVAIKKCKFNLPSSLTSKQRDRWKKEVEMINLIKHPNVIGHKPISADLESALMKHNPSKLPLMSMEYCRNGNLRHVLCKWKNISGLEEPEVVDILWDVSRGLEHLHKLNITHRDIKPENIVLQNCDDGPGRYVYKIIDLGYAKELSDTVVSFVGTLQYLAPEIFKTEPYTKSVDYWSLGLLTFEIICGVLPFLPHQTPVESFLKVKDKALDDICIYRNYSGGISYSNEIKKENFISTCLKQNIEVWLRHVLQYDKNLRSQPFPNGMGVFTYLQNLLNKTVITVISLNKLEIYSYEVSDSTLLSTLNDWICRDIKAKRSDIVLLVDKKTRLKEDSALLLELLGQERCIYIIRNDYSISSPHFPVPKLVREALKSAMRFNRDFVRNLCAQTIYFIKLEHTLSEHFKTGFKLYIKYLIYIVEKLKRGTRAIFDNLKKLSNKIEGYNEKKKNNLCDVNLRDNSEYKECLSWNQRLIASLERCVSNTNSLEEKVAIVEKRRSVLESSLPVIEDILRKYDLSPQYSEILDLFEKKESNPKMNITSLTKLASSTIKCKHTFFKETEFHAYSKMMASVLKKCDILMPWVERFNSHIADLSVSFEQNQIFYENILQRATENDRYRRSPQVPYQSFECDFLELSSLTLAEDNYHLRNKFDELISRSIQANINYSQIFDVL